ncbi:unknown protein; 114093-112086 [Arabidopsis thaliana]|uniref:Uncharacterized protein F24K9.27 n=1 Tax=Arabidopsis thaliana TaxID=3702 RepID=Q9CAW8_ARATH|nr:unknown protein; 114093-112086 [Arabidopsis thaliana]
MEIQAENPTFHVLFIPGNPGVVSFYKDFLESLYEFLGGNASVIGMAALLFEFDFFESLRWKLFISEFEFVLLISNGGVELESVKVPIILVGHSIGSYISLELLKKFSDKVVYCIGLYPFLTLNQQSTKQSLIGKLAASSVLSATASFLIASLRLLPMSAARLLVSKSIGASWSDTAVQATCTHLRQYHTMRNVLFMAKSEFREISKQAPHTSLSIEREGHTHGFCCTVAGSAWVAQHVATLIKNRFSQLQ